MQMLRLDTLALLAVVAATASGCRTAGVGDLARPDPPLAPISSTKAAEILAEHNRNAERIQVIDAKPSLAITVYEKPNQPPSNYSVNGRMTMERPKNFKLEIFTTASTVADFGSNDSEYWFWVRDMTQKAIYYCNYDDTGASPLAATFQPDWIIEAMGLRVIPEAEAAEIKITEKPGDPGKLILTHRPHRAGDASFTRVTILDKATHQILEHQIRSGDQKTLLARAVVPEGYMRLPVSTVSGSEASHETVVLPKRIQLSWIQEKLDLDVQFPHQYVRINNPIEGKRRPYLFVEPQLGRGYTRKNLAEDSPATASSTTIRETRPAPASGGGVRLREPTPLEGENSARREAYSNPVALSGAEPLTPSLTDDVIGAQVPTAPEPAYLRPENPGWRAAAVPALDR